MKSIICLLVTLGVAYGAILPAKPNCVHSFCTMIFLTCADGKPAPVPANGCCPSLSACKPHTVIDPKPVNCESTFCTMDLKICPDGTFAPIPAGECCPNVKACSKGAISRRSNPLGALGSLLSGNNLLQSLSTATHGTNLGTAISILNLLNNIQQLTTDIHQIPLLINQTLINILNGTGQASQVVIDQLIGAVTNIVHPAASRDLLGSLGQLGQSASLLSSIGHLLPQGTSISTILAILKLLNNVNALSTDIHQIPVLLNQTLAGLVGGAGQAGQILVQQLLGLIGAHPQSASRDLLGSLGQLGQSASLLSSIGHLLPQGTSISTILAILKLLNNVNALNTDLHQIPVLLNQTLAGLVGGAGQAGQILVQQLLGLIGAHPQSASRNLLGALGQNANLLSTVSHLLPQGTSITTIIALLNLLNNVNSLNTDLHQIPAVLQETLQNLLSGIQHLIPPTLQPVQ